MNQRIWRGIAPVTCFAAGFATAALFFPPLQGVARQSRPADKPIASALVRAEDAVPTRGDWGQWRRYFRGETHGTRDMVMLAVTLKSGQEPHPPHRHAEEEFMILAEGTGTWHLDGKDSPARRGDVVYAAPWAMHGVKNTGDGPLTYYMFKWNNKGVKAPESPAPKRKVESDKPTEVAVLRGHTNVVPDLGLSADGRTLATASFDKTVRVWDLPSGKERFVLRGHKHLVDFATITPDGKTVASADQDGVIKLWDAVTGKERFTLTKPVGPRPQGRLEFLAFTTDGKTLAWQRHPRWVERNDVATGEKRPPLEAPEKHLWTPEGSFLPWEGAAAFKVSPDGKTVVAHGGQRDSIQLYEMATGNSRAVLKAVEARELRAVAFHPGGRVLACGPRKRDGTLRLVDVATGEAWAELRGENCDGVFEAAFSADGNTLAVAESPDTAIRVYDVSAIWKMKPPFEEPRTERDLESSWADLAGDDAAKVNRALWTLAGASKKSLPWIGRQLPPIVTASEKVTAPLLAALDDDRGANREQAWQKLEDLGESALPALEKASKANPSPEVRRRVERLLDSLRRPANTPDRLRQLRAVEALERADTSEAREVLENLARGTPQALRTREAKAALERLARRTAVRIPATP